VKIVFFDTSQSTGWAVADGGRIVESGVQSFAKRRGESNGLVFLRFRKWLYDFIEITGPDVIGYERAHFRGAGTELLAGLQTRVQEAIAEFCLVPAPLHTAEIKRFATGRGNAPKADMVAAAVPVLGRDPVTDDEADAVFGALCVASQIEV
jgi:Holliday junction resolvasome RuvABC endonuclease subunit